MDLSNLNYKVIENSSEDLFQQTNEQNYSQYQNFIFSQLQSTEDTSDIYTLLSLLSETIDKNDKTLNANFYSKWFIKIIENCLTNSPVLVEICIIIIIKLIYICNSICFLDQYFIDLYFYLLDKFNDKKMYEFKIESSNDPIINLRIQIMRLISFISADETRILTCIIHTQQIIQYLEETQNDMLVLFYSSFVLNVLKYKNKTQSSLEFNLKISTIINLINSQNIKIKQLGIELFNQFLPYIEQKSEEQFLSDFIPDFINLLDDDLYEIISLTIRIFETLYSLKINFENSIFHTDVLDKVTKLLLHRTPTVRNSALRCIGCFISNFEGEFIPSDELIHNLIILAARKGSFDSQMKIARILSNIVSISPSSYLVNLPIQKIFNFFVHIFESDCLDIISLVLDATLILVDAIQKFEIDHNVLQPIINFDFSELSEEIPEKVELINSKKNELQKGGAL